MDADGFQRDACVGTVKFVTVLVWMVWTLKSKSAGGLVLGALAAALVSHQIKSMCDL